MQAPGVTFDVEPQDPKARAFYYIGGTFSTTATETDRNGTALIYVPAGTVAVTTTIASVGQVVSREQDVIIRPGTLTAIYAPPTP